MYALNCTVCRVALIHHLMPHICVSELGNHWIQAMPYHFFGAIIFSTGLLWTTLGKIQIKIQNVSFMRTHLKMSPAKRRPYFPGVHELTTSVSTDSMHYSVTAFLVESQWPFFSTGSYIFIKQPRHGQFSFTQDIYGASIMSCEICNFMSH